MNNILISDKFTAWQAECEARFQQLKANEEELNRIFIDIYGLQDELTPEVADKDVTVHRIFNTKDDVPESMKGSNYVRTLRDEIVSLISYAVGCLFGRYSLDVEGLAYAGGEWDSSKYQTIIPDADNILPICDDDYFEDDLTGKFVDFVRVVYGEDTLEENLKFISDALGGKGAPREIIRSYFINDFFADHCKTYQKRPIYWLFDSGKKNGFKALIYLHRYQRDLLARMRTDYVHEQQERYRTQLSHLADALEHASGADKVRLTKQQKKLQDQSRELQTYEEKIHHLADQNIELDLDDGVKVNYAKFGDVLAKIKQSESRYCMATNKLKVMLSFMREINDGNMPTAADYEITNRELWEIIDACQDEGLIKGAVFSRGGNGNRILICYTEGITLTVKGLEYLDEHSAAMRAYRGLKEIREWLPF